MVNRFWNNKRVLVTGGASFIGSNLVDQLIMLGAKVRVVDDLSSGVIANIQSHILSKSIEYIEGDLRNAKILEKSMRNIDIVFHLAADHGGRGYVELHQSDTANNFVIDGLVFQEAVKQKVNKLIYASSGCIYPNFLQKDVTEELYLKEDTAGPPYDCDNLYGWAKMMAELQLKALYNEHGLVSTSCRFFTVYGPRGVENHAIIALIAKALIKQNPFEVWGDGNQIRNWTHVDDIVRGMILSAEKVNNATSINLGTKERIKVIDAVNMIFDYFNFHPKINFRLDMPVGPANRVADNAKAKELLKWEPKIKFSEGLISTIDWYINTHEESIVKDNLQALLTNR